MTIEFLAPGAVVLEAARAVHALGQRAVRGRVDRVFHGSAHTLFHLTDESGAALRCRVAVDRSIQDRDTVRVIGELVVWIAKGDLLLDVITLVNEDADQ